MSLANTQATVSSINLHHITVQPFYFIAFVKERFHNAVEIDILGIFEGYSLLQNWAPKNIFQERNYSGQMT